MAGFIAAPQVCFLKVSGTISGNPWNCMLHFVTTGPSGSWTSAQLTAMGNALLTSVQGSMQTAWGANVTWSSVEGIDLSNSTPQIGTSTHAPFSGTATGLSVANTAIMFNYLTAQRYRGGHGRTYLPGAADNFTTDGDHWVASTFNGWVTDWATALQATAQAAVTNGQPTVTLCIPLYQYSVTDDPIRHKYIRQKVAFKTAANVLSVIGANDIRSQRRRAGNR